VRVFIKGYRQEAEFPLLPTPTLLLQSKVVLHLEALLISVGEINFLDTQMPPFLKILHYSKLYWRMLFIYLTAFHRKLAKQYSFHY
jgi:hypothetical protein